LANPLQVILHLLSCPFPASGSRATRNCWFARRNQHRLSVKSGTGCPDARRRLGMLVLKRTPALCKLKAGDYKPALEITLVLTPQAAANLLGARTGYVPPTAETRQLFFTCCGFPVPTLPSVRAQGRDSPCAERSPSAAGQFCDQDSSHLPFSRSAVS